MASQLDRALKIASFAPKAQQSQPAQQQTAQPQATPQAVQAPAPQKTDHLFDEDGNLSISAQKARNKQAAYNQKEDYTAHLTDKRSKLLEKFNASQQAEAYATDPWAADEAKKQTQSYADQLHDVDKQLKQTKAYTPAEELKDFGRRLISIGKAAGTGSASGYVGAAAGTANMLNDVRDDALAGSSDFERAMADSMYAGYATDDLSIGNAQAAYAKDKAAVTNDNIIANDKAVAARYTQVADDLAKKSAAETAKAKDGLGAVGNMAVDVAVNALQMAGDAAGSAVGLGMVPFFVRAAGGSMNEARADGASNKQAFTFGIAKGAVEVLTEKMFGGIAGWQLGKADESALVEALTKRLAQTDAGRTVIRAVLTAAGEGVEEVVSDLADPFAKAIYDKGATLDSLGTTEGKLAFLENAGYDFLLGAVTASIGQTANVLTGGSARANEALRAEEAAQAATTTPTTAEQSTPVAADTNVPTTKAPAAPARTPEQQYVFDLLTGGNVSNKQASSITQNADFAQAFQELTGVDLNGSAAQQRRQVKEAAESFSKPPETVGDVDAAHTAPEAATAAPVEFDRGLSVDTAQQTPYNETTTNTGGENNGRNLENDAAPAQAGRAAAESADVGRGVPGGSRLDSRGTESGQDGRTDSVLARAAVSEASSRALEAQGVQNTKVQNSDTDGVRFETAMADAMASQPYGAAVSVKTADDISQIVADGGHAFLTEDGSAGIVVTKDGDVEGVFKNKKTGNRSSFANLMVAAIENGGKKLDCYGLELVNRYAKFGFRPVAQVDFNREYAAEGWNYDIQGEPQIYFMVYDGAPVSETIANRPNAKQYTQAELDALPRFNKEGYDDAAEYRDTKLPKQTLMNEDEGIPSNDRITEPVTEKRGKDDDGGNPPTPPTGGSTTEAIEKRQAGTLSEDRDGNPPGPRSSEQEGRLSQFWTNTLRRTEQAAGTPDAVTTPLYYLPISEIESLGRAASRLSADHQGTVEDLVKAEAWSGVQSDSAALISSELYAQALDTGDFSGYSAWRKVMQEHVTATAQGLQAWAKYTRRGQTLLDEAMDNGASEETLQRLLPIARELDDIQERQEQRRSRELNNQDNQNNQDDNQNNNRDDNPPRRRRQNRNNDENRDGPFTEEERMDYVNLILRIAEMRRVGTFVEHNLPEWVMRQSDDWLADAAYYSALGMVNDTRNVGGRALAAKVAGYRVMSMLLGFGSGARNVTGNASFSIIDLVAQQTLGRMYDAAIGAETGKRTIVRQRRGPKVREWFRNANEAAVTAAAEVALDIDMSGRTTDADRGGPNVYTASSANPAERFLHRVSQAVSYMLQVPDAFFEGGIQQGEIANLMADGRTNLTLEEMDALAQSTSDYRLFKNDTPISDWIMSNVRGLNNVLGIGGAFEWRDGRRVRTADNTFGLGSIAAPFVKVPTNLVLKPVEYSFLNTANGVYQLFSIMHDAHSGVEIDAVRQKNAAMNLARGVTGTGMIAMAAALALKGLLKNYDDEDDEDLKAQYKAQGLTGTRLNITGALRALRGEKTGWEPGDFTIGVEGIQPLDSFLNIGANIAQMAPTTIGGYADAYLAGVYDSVKEMPMFSYIAELEQQTRYIDTSEEGWVGDLAGRVGATTVSNVAGSFIPQFVKSAGRVLDPYVRDSTGNTPTQQAWNQFLQGVPIARQALPEKLDNFGNPISNGTVTERILNNMMLPSKIMTVKDTGKVAQETTRLQEATGIKSVTPDRKAPSKLSNDGQKYELTAVEKRQYQETMGQAVEEMVGELMKTAYYKGLDDKQKANVITQINGYAKEYAKEEALTKRGIDVDISSRADGLRSAINSGMDIGAWFKANDKYNELRVKEGASATDKATAFASYLDKERSLRAKDRAALREQFTFWSQRQGEAGKYDKLTDAGLSNTTAKNVYDIVDKLQPFDGKDTVVDSQKTSAIASSKLSDSDKLTAIEVYGSTGMYNRYRTAQDRGIPLELWGKVEEAISLGGNNKKDFQRMFGSDANTYYSIYSKPTKYKVDEKKPESTFSNSDWQNMLAGKSPSKSTTSKPSTTSNDSWMKVLGIK